MQQRHHASWMRLFGDPSEGIQELADRLVATLTQCDDVAPDAYWSRFTDRSDDGLRSIFGCFERHQVKLSARDIAFVNDRMMFIVAQWRAWLDSADRADPVAYYRRFGDLVVASCWYLLCYPLAQGLRNGTAAGLDRSPFLVELALIEREDGSEVFVPHIPIADEKAERLLRRAHLMASLKSCDHDRMTDEHRFSIRYIGSIDDDVLSDDDLLQLEDVLDAISDAHMLECTHAGRRRLTSWIRSQAIQAAQKLIASGKGDASRLRKAIETPEEQWTFALANGIQRMRIQAEGVQ